MGGRGGPTTIAGGRGGGGGGGGANPSSPSIHTIHQAVKGYYNVLKLDNYLFCQKKSDSVMLNIL